MLRSIQSTHYVLIIDGRGGSVCVGPGFLSNICLGLKYLGYREVLTLSTLPIKLYTDSIARVKMSKCDGAAVNTAHSTTRQTNHSIPITTEYTEL